MAAFTESVNVIIKKLKSEKENNSNNSVISNIQNQEILIFFELLAISPVSLPHKNKSHRSKNESEKTFYINTFSLSNCIMSFDGIKPTNM